MRLVLVPVPVSLQDGALQVSRGRKATPPGVKAAREGRRVRGVVPPDPPTWLSESAKADYLRLAPELAKCGAMQTFLDVDALAVYCDLFAAYREARAADDHKRAHQLVTSLRHAGDTLQRRITTPHAADPEIGELQQFLVEDGAPDLPDPIVS